MTSIDLSAETKSISETLDKLSLPEEIRSGALAFQPGENWTYFPTVPEILMTVGIVAIEIMAYIVIVKKFPILSGRPVAASAS